jgi:hypothetical protein
MRHRHAPSQNFHKLDAYQIGHQSQLQLLPELEATITSLLCAHAKPSKRWLSVFVENFRESKFFNRCKRT